jgi:hypothetical protein
VTILVDVFFTSSVCIAMSRLDHAEEHGVRSAWFQALKSVVSIPLTWGIGLGAMFSAHDWVLPDMLNNTVGLLAAAAPPVALFTIGAVLVQPSRADSQPWRQFKTGGLDVLLTLVKLLVHPMLIGSLGWLWGPSGSGKSHLLQAVCAQLPGSGYFPMQQLSSFGPAVLEGIEALCCVCLDDVHVIAAQPDWEAALFRLYVEVDARQGRLLLAAEQPAVALPWALLCSVVAEAALTERTLVTLEARKLASERDAASQKSERTSESAPRPGPSQLSQSTRGSSDTSLLVAAHCGATPPTST